MKVKIGNAVYDSEVTPICLELSDVEKEYLANLGDQNKFSSFPDNCWGTAQPCIDWMKFDYDPTKIYTYYDRKVGEVVVRSDIDNVTCLHYADGTKREVDAPYLYTHCFVVFEEPRAAPLLFSNFLLPAMIRYKDLCLTRCSLNSEAISVFGRHFECVNALNETDQEDYTYLSLWSCGIVQTIEQAIILKDKP